MTEKQNTTQMPKSMTTEPQANQSCFDSSSIFSSQDFGKFLSKECPSSNPCLSMDVPLAGSLDEASAFKSKDAFSQLYSSNDWGMMKLKPDLLPETRNDVQLKDWMPSLNLPIKTPWDKKVHMSQIQLMLPQPSPEEEPSPPEFLHTWAEKGLDLQLSPEEEHSPLDDFHRWTEEGLDLSSSDDLSVFPDPYLEVEESFAPVQSSSDISGKKSLDISGKKKRSRPPPPKFVPSTKEYVEPTLNDVLLGRGARSNHHPGNKRYREEVKNLRELYVSIGDKKEKANVSQILLDRIQKNSRFLDKDANGWYVVHNLEALRKASQSLRENDDPDKQAAKRQRFLEKRARENQERHCKNEKRSRKNERSQDMAV